MTNTWMLSLLALSVVGGAAAGRALPAANKPVEVRPAKGREQPTTPSSTTPSRPRTGVSVPFNCCANIEGRNECVSGACPEDTQPTCRPSRDEISVSCKPRRERRASER